MELQMLECASIPTTTTTTTTTTTSRDHWATWADKPIEPLSGTQVLKLWDVKKWFAARIASDSTMILPQSFFHHISGFINFSFSDTRLSDKWWAVRKRRQAFSKKWTLSANTSVNINQKCSYISLHIVHCFNLKQNSLLPTHVADSFLHQRAVR